MAEPRPRPPMRSPLGRAIGLGSAKEGVEHWWALRVTSIALVLVRPRGLAEASLTRSVNRFSQLTA